ncbi:unnamed protein product [Tilletia laevis]|uniref:Velvet domain-containing protein n=1 Tax=Tilletia laevis TaxID=157183 RepID=A0A9N8MB54_9BASI|nr:unnamed protein product [Tilletia caries]CAD6965795.1 unnamed protein product [Tilletia laevis]CAD6969630.1 unnamed protein product [Tilletia controversa]
MSEPPPQGPSRNPHSSSWNTSRQGSSSSSLVVPTTESLRPSLNALSVGDRGMQAPIPTASGTFFTTRYGRPSRSAEGVRIGPEQTERNAILASTGASSSRHAQGSKLRSNTWTSASERLSHTITSPSFTFPSPEDSRFRFSVAATPTTIPGPRPTLPPLSYLTTPDTRRSPAQPYEQQLAPMLAPLSSPEQAQLSSSSAHGSEQSKRPRSISSSPTAMDREPTSSQNRDDYQVSPSGLVKTMSAGLLLEEAEEAPPPSLCSMQLDPRGEPRVAEQPARGRLSGFTTRDRRMINPTPIVSLQVFDRNGELDVGAMSAPHFLVQVTIQAVDGTDRALVLNPANGRAYRMMEGVPLQNGTYVAEDRTTYFAFPDLSVRLAGRFHLLFSLTSTADAAIASATSQEFEVFSPRRFPGVLNSSSLTRRLAERGVKVHLRNCGSSTQ